MVIFKENNVVYCQLNEVFTLPYLKPSNVRHVQVIHCPYGLCDYDTKTDTLFIPTGPPNPPLTVMDASYDLTYVNLEMKFLRTGTFTIYVGYGTVTLDNCEIYTFHVFPVLTELSMIFYEITDTEQLARLLDGKDYTIEAQLLVTGEDASHYKDYLYNYRIGVCNTEIDTTSQQTILDLISNAEFSDQPVLNEKTRVTSDFTYDEDQPLFVLITLDYAEGYPNEFKLSFDSIKIYESTSNLVGMKCLHIAPIQNSISDNNTSSITLNEFTTSNTFTCSRFQKDGDDIDDEDITYGNDDEDAITGLALKMDVASAGNVTLLATLTSEKSRIGQKSLLISPNTENETLTLGDSDDLWGFDVADFENLEDWELTLQILNNTPNNNSIVFNNIRLECYTSEIEPNAYDYFIEDNNLGYYGVFMQDIDIPVGLNTDHHQLEIEGSDVNTITRQNIREKTITLEFSIYDCDPVTSHKRIQKLARLIYNERDIHTDRPIPKKFSTNLYHGKEWEYVVLKEMETSFEAGEITGKVELVVPSGTYITTDEIVTGEIGYNNGLNKMQPEILLGNIKGDEITITENVSGQKFTIRDITYYNGTTLTVDCQERTIHQSNPDSEEDINVINNCDLDNDWFSINNEYNFTCNNATIMKVTYYERG